MQMKFAGALPLNGQVPSMRHMVDNSPSTVVISPLKIEGKFCTIFIIIIIINCFTV